MPCVVEEWKKEMPLNNYLKALAAQKRICPECKRNALKMRAWDNGERDHATEYCDCGYVAIVNTPLQYRIGIDPEYVPTEQERLIRELQKRLDRKKKFKEQAIQPEKTKQLSPQRGKEGTGRIIEVQFKPKH